MKTRKHITEKELKAAAKDVRLQFGVIDHIIAKIRENQAKWEQEEEDEIPSVLDILKGGGIILFPSGYKLQGDPETNYIQLFLPLDTKDGLCILNEKGLKEAFQYAKDFETYTKEQDNDY